MRRGFVASAAFAAALMLTTAAGGRLHSAPDLVDVSIGKAPARLAPGTAFTVVDVVSNRGAVRARPSVTRFLLRSGKTSLLAGLRHVPSLKAHGSSRVRVRLRVPATARAAGYSLVACVDATHSVREANERNNCRIARGRVSVTVAEAPPPAPSPTPTPAPGKPDSDHDGTLDTADCAPRDASIHPGATDKPDLQFVDSNCDGIDGDAGKSIFVTTGGKDTNPGTRDKPKRSVATAVVAAAKSKSAAVLVATGTYAEGGGVEVADGVGIYGGYAPSNWSRSTSVKTVITGSPQAVLADGARGVTLQLLTLQSGTAGLGSGASTYAVRAINRSKITIEHSTLQAGDGLPGFPGVDGRAGANGEAGGQGRDGDDDRWEDVSLASVAGGAGGASTIGAQGGNGGHGGRQVEEPSFLPGSPGSGPLGGAGGAGGQWGDPGEDGRPGLPGGDGGRVGTPGAGGARGVDLAGAVWRGHEGGAGTAGASGSGGGGGGGGGGQHCILCTDGTGSGGGGGGAGGGAGLGGGGGLAGGGSFGVYLRDSEVHLSGGTTISTGTGGAGGAGGEAGSGGFGGPGGPGGGKSITSGEIGRGGDGGRGGFGTHGGAGGGGPGGPSMGIFEFGTSRADVEKGVTITPGPGGRGGSGGAPGGLGGQSGYSAGLFSTV